MEKTARGKHESGDTAWEEQNLNVYAKSEVRFTEIGDLVCADVSRSQDQCYTFFEESEEVLSAWFTKNQDEHPDLYEYLCIESKQVCCKPNTYGPNCLPCSDCNDNGSCKGNGTRKGSGKCACHAGYTGEFCTECALDYYESFRDNDKLLCSKCHVACEKNTGCTGAGAKNCRVCKMGWTMEQEGCTDIDECSIGSHKCTKNEFCVNNDGSFECLSKKNIFWDAFNILLFKNIVFLLECDRSCDGCTGDGPDLCEQCASGYELRDGMCAGKLFIVFFLLIDSREFSSRSEETHKIKLKWQAYQGTPFKYFNPHFVVDTKTNILYLYAFVCFCYTLYYYLATIWIE